MKKILKELKQDLKFEIELEVIAFAVALPLLVLGALILCNL
ncbi:hypothetical protein [Bacillus cereus]|nr:hypothetical protein [Bacillus cereus]